MYTSLIIATREFRVQTTIPSSGRAQVLFTESNLLLKYILFITHVLIECVSLPGHSILSIMEQVHKTAVYRTGPHRHFAYTSKT